MTEMTDRVEKAKAIMFASFEEHHIEDTVTNRLAFCNIWKEGWEDEASKPDGGSPEKIFWYKMDMVLEVQRLGLEQLLKELG